MKESNRTENDKRLRARLNQLQRETEAYMTMVITTSGYPVNVIGLTDGLDVSALAALVAGNFLAAHEIATMLGKKSSFKLSYYESDQHNIYVYGISEEYLLLTVFGGETKPGVVWFYTQRAVAELADILKRLEIEDEREDILHNVSDGELQDAIESAWDSAFLPANNGVDLKTAGNQRQVDASLLSFSEAVDRGVFS